MPIEQEPSPGTIRRRRLMEADARPRLYPWSRASDLEPCQLYWMPVSTFPIGFLQRRWLLRFQELLRLTLAEKLSVMPEVFLQMNSIDSTNRDLFIKNSSRFHPLFGLGRHPKQPLPAVPGEKYAEDLQKGKITYDHNSLRPEYSYWFLEKHAAEQLHMFYGAGGTTTLFLEPGEPPQKAPKPKLSAIRDPNMRELVANSDVDAMVGRLNALQAPFLKKSKEMFAADLKEDPQYPGLLFTLPLLSSRDFFSADPPEVEAWFSLFKLYLRESPEDKGMIMATSADFEEDLEGMLQKMKVEGLEYPA